MYLSYADFGFLASGKKFAAEAVATDRLKDEIVITGFIFFILIITFIPFIFIACYFASAPNILISQLSDGNFSTAQYLLLVIGLLVPFQIILERFSLFISEIRLKDYLVTRLNVFFSIIKIFSIFMFIDGDNIRIVEYFLFTTVVSIIAALIVLNMISKKIGYDLKLLIMNIKFSRSHYSKTSKLSWNTFFLTIAFVIYYEIDLIIIGKLMSAEEVAIYAVGFTLINFLRSLFNIVYSPFSHRFNHFAGVKDTKSIIRLLQKLIFFGVPLYVITVTMLTLTSEYLINYWVGDKYDDSIWPTKLLFTSMVFGCLIKPSGYFFTSILNYNYIRMLAIVGVLVFFGSLLVLYPQYGLLSFAITKILVGLSLFVVCLFGLRHHNWVTRELLYMIPVLLMSFLILVTSLPHLLDIIFQTSGKNALNLSMLFLLSLVILLVTLFVVFIGTKYTSHAVKNIFKG